MGLGTSCFAGNAPTRHTLRDLMDTATYIAVSVTRFVRDEGTLILFAARAEDDEEVTIARPPSRLRRRLDGGSDAG